MTTSHKLVIALPDEYDLNTVDGPPPRVPSHPFLVRLHRNISPAGHLNPRVVNTSGSHRDAHTVEAL